MDTHKMVFLVFPPRGDPVLHIPRAVPWHPQNLCCVLLPTVMLLAWAARQEVQLGSNRWIEHKTNNLRS